MIGSLETINVEKQGLPSRIMVSEMVSVYSEKEALAQSHGLE